MGEKLVEELFYAREEVQPTSFPKIKRIRGAQNRWSEIQYHLEELRASMSIDGAAPIRAKMKEIVPEYVCGPDSQPKTSVAQTVPSAPKVLRQAASAD